MVVIEKAKTSRSVCKNCKRKIEKDELRCILEERGFQFTIKKTLCKDCGIAHLKRIKKEAEEQIKILELQE